MTAKIGDRIRIKFIDDPYAIGYEGQEGIVEHIDSLGHLFGTWGGLAVIPEIDEFVVITK